MSRPTVSVCWTSLLRYRLPFYESLREELNSRGVEMRLVVSESAEGLAKRGDSVTTDWAEFVATRRMELGGVEWIIQDLRDVVSSSDVIVLEQGNRILSNLYVLLRRRLTGRPRVAMWGHGLTATSRGRIRDLAKRLAARQVDWWFSYSDGGRLQLEEMGVRHDRITVVKNATDTRSLRSGLNCVSHDDRAELENELGIRPGVSVVLTIAGFDADKDPSYTVDVLQEIVRQSDDTVCIICGGGTDAPAVEASVASNERIHFLGPTFGARLLRCLDRADVLVQPGKIGLVAVDSLAAGVPLVAVESRPHAPEFEYLESDRNSIILPGLPSAESYGTAVVELLKDAPRLSRLGDQAQADSADLSVEAMATRFAEGLISALDL